MCESRIACQRGPGGGRIHATSEEFAFNPRPRDEDGDVLMCLQLDRMSNVTWTSSGVGTLDGNGERW